MITSSKFFEKSFFTLDYAGQKISPDELSPWGLYPNNAAFKQKSIPNPETKKKDVPDNRGYQISRNSSLKYIQRKLKSRSFLNHSRDISKTNDNSKYYTIQQKLNSVDSKNDIKCTNSVDTVMVPKKRQKKKTKLFPQLTINQYNDLKAKGSGIMGTNSLEQILQRRRNRRKILQQFGRGSPRPSKNKDNHSKSIDAKNVLSGRYVCAVKSQSPPQFSVHGFPTTKLLDQY